MFPVSLMLYLLGRIMDLENRRLRYRAIALGTYVGYSIVSDSAPLPHVIMADRPDILLGVPGA